MQLKSRNYETITNANTIAQWVDAFNNNALSGSDLQLMIGEATFSSVLFTGLETVGNGVNSYKMEAWKDVSPEFKAVFPDDLVLDNWYVYFRPIGKFILVSQLHVDLTDYSHYDNNEFVEGDLYHFFLNYELGFRVSHNPIPKEGESRLFRFIATESSFSQFIPTFPRYFYSGNNTDYETVTGLDVQPSGLNTIGLSDGWVDYDGIAFDNHPVPDKKKYETNIEDKITIVDSGMGYNVHDIVPTNITDVNALVTAIDYPMNTDIEWVESTNYYIGDHVQYYGNMEDFGEYEALQHNAGTTPSRYSTVWKFLGRVGAINKCIPTEDPVDFVGTGAELEVKEVDRSWDLLYNTPQNKLNYSQITKIVDATQIMNYKTNEMSDVEPGKFTIQRVHLDYLTDTLIMQYGNTLFDTMNDALNAVYSLDFPFVYNTYIFPVLAYMVVRSDYTDLSDPEQCVIVQVRTRSTNIIESENLANDSWARALIAQQAQQIKFLNRWLTQLQAQHDQLQYDFTNHISNNFPTPPNIKDGNNQNPHRVTKAEVGLGSVDNIAVADMLVPSTSDVASGNTDGKLKHVRIALDDLDRVLKNYTDSKTGINNITDGSTNIVQWVDRNFLWKTKSDSTSANTWHQIRNIVTSSKMILFNNSTTVSGSNPNPSTNGQAWFVGDLPPTDYEAYGVKKSE